MIQVSVDVELNTGEVVKYSSINPQARKAEIESAINSMYAMSNSIATEMWKITKASSEEDWDGGIVKTPHELILTQVKLGLKGGLFDVTYDGVNLSPDSPEVSDGKYIELTQISSGGGSGVWEVDFNE